MKKNQFNKVKKYRKKRIGVITTKNIVLLTIIIATFVSVGYSYWNTTLHIGGTVSIAGNSGGGSNGGTWTNPVVDSTTTTYDPSNVQEGTTRYDGVTGKPQVTADRNGKITRFQYTDTGNGIAVPSGGLDTGVLGFDGRDFVVTLKAMFTYANCSTSICPIINVSKKDPTVNGILIYESGHMTSGYGHNASGSNVASPYNKFRFNKYENSTTSANVDYNIESKVTASQANGRYGYNSSSSPVTLTIKLYCTNGVFSSEIYDSSASTDVLLAKPYNNTTYSFSNTNNTSFDDITVVIGQYDGFGAGVSYTHNFTILEFNVVKQ